MINDQVGVNGRRITLIRFDDAYSPPKTVEQTRKLVEQDEVAAILNPLGTPTGLSVRKYLNDRKVQQLFVGAGATLWGGRSPPARCTPACSRGDDRGNNRVAPALGCGT